MGPHWSSSHFSDLKSSPPTRCTKAPDLVEFQGSGLTNTPRKTPSSCFQKTYLPLHVAGVRPCRSGEKSGWRRSVFWWLCPCSCCPAPCFHGINCLSRKTTRSPSYIAGLRPVLSLLSLASWLMFIFQKSSWFQTHFIWFFSVSSWGSLSSLRQKPGSIFLLWGY